MKRFLIALFAILVLTVIPSALAMTVEINGESTGQVSVVAGDTVPVKVISELSANYSGAVLEMELKYSHGKKVDLETKSIDMTAGKRYVWNLDLEIPSGIDPTVSGKTYTVSFTLKDDSGNTIDLQNVAINVQRGNDEIDIQKVMTTYAKAGQPTIITVVAKNLGSDNQDDTYVEISIPKLGLVAEERMGDLASVDSGDDEDVATADIPLRIPEDAEEGSYTLNVKVYNDNTEVTTQKTISIEGLPNRGKFVEIVPNIRAQDVEQGQTAVYTLRIANLGNTDEEYSISVEGTEGWATYQINPLTMTLSKEASQMVSVSITADKTALAGEHGFTVKAVSGTAAKSIALTANVKEQNSAGVSAMLISVIVLAVVLLILVVLLVKTRKAGDELAEAEESYY